MAVLSLIVIVMNLENSINCNKKIKKKKNITTFDKFQEVLNYKIFDNLYKIYVSGSTNIWIH